MEEFSLTPMYQSTVKPANVRATAALLGIAVVSLILFQLYRKFEYVLDLYPSMSVLTLALVSAACTSTSNITYASVPPALRIMMRGLGMACGLYSISLFPAIPPVAHAFGGWSQHMLVGAWLASGIAALLAWWRPSWLVFASFYLYFIKSFAEYISGFPIDTLLDILPMMQLPAYLGLSVVALELAKRSRLAAFSRITGTLHESGAAPYFIILFVAIAMQAGNYVYSSLAKAALDGGPFDWMLNNENRNIFHIALYNKQLLWGDWTWLTDAVSGLLDVVGRPFAIAIFILQLGALLVFASRKLLLTLFALLDLMHVGIFVLVGANFWTWFMVNLSIIAAVSKLPKEAFNWKTGIVGAAAIALSPLYAQVAKLGWYDSLAVNSAYFSVVHANGRLARVPSTFFGFYSYPISHMSFGFPPGTYLPTLTNGGTFSSAILRQSYRCDFLLSDSPQKKWNGRILSDFVKGYHHQILTKVGPDGRWSNIVYPHHFWSSPSIEHAFAEVDMRQVRAYVMVIDSVCLDPETGAMKRKVYRNEYRIDVAGN